MYVVFLSPAPSPFFSVLASYIVSSGMLAAVYSVFYGDVKQSRSDNKKIFMLSKNIFMVFDFPIKYAIVAFKLIRGHDIRRWYRLGRVKAGDRKTGVLGSLQVKPGYGAIRKYCHSDTIACRVSQYIILAQWGKGYRLSPHCLFLLLYLFRGRRNPFPHIFAPHLQRT